MMPGDDIRAMAERVRALMHARLGARGACLSQALASRGKALPRKLRGPAQALAAAEAVAMAPKLARQVDLSTLRRHEAALCAHLAPIGRRGRWIAALRTGSASVVLGLVVLAVVILWLLARRGVIGP